MKNNAHVKWLKDEGAIIQKDNIFYAPRAFMAHSVLKWCREKIKEKNIDEVQVEDFLKTIRYFIKKKIDLSWKNGILTASVYDKTTANGEDNHECLRMETKDKR